MNRLLFERGIDRVMLDNRALFSAAPSDAETRAAQGRKPRLPVHAISLGPRPFIRYIGHPDIAANAPFLAPWLEKLALWLDEGREPYVFIHTPNNRQAPQLARFSTNGCGHCALGLARCRQPSHPESWEAPP